MPNLMRVVIDFRGEKSHEVAKLLENRKDDATRSEEKIDFGSIIPENTGDEFWYSWRVKHWGTKWNAFNSDMTVEDGCVHVEFTTAWCLPGPVMDKLKDKCRELDVDMSGYFSDDYDIMNSGVITAGEVKFNVSYSESEKTHRKVWGEQ